MASFIVPYNHRRQTQGSCSKLHAVSARYTRIIQETVDTNILVLAVAFTHDLAAQKLWVVFGISINLQHFAGHHTSLTIGLERATALHALIWGQLFYMKWKNQLEDMECISRSNWGHQKCAIIASVKSNWCWRSWGPLCDITIWQKKFCCRYK